MAKADWARLMAAFSAEMATYRSNHRSAVEALRTKEVAQAQAYLTLSSAALNRAEAVHLEMVEYLRGPRGKNSRQVESSVIFRNREVI